MGRKRDEEKQNENKQFSALAGVAQWTERQPMDR